MLQRVLPSNTVGMGTIQIRGKKHRIRVAFVYRSIRRFENTDYYCETGKNNCKCRQCRSALALLAEIERKIDEGIFKYGDFFPESKALKTLNDLKLADTSANVGFSTYANQWLDLIEDSIAYSTHKTYSSDVSKLCQYFGNVELKKIRPTHIQMFIKQCNLSPKSISNIIGVLHQILDNAYNDELLSKNPTKVIKKPRVETSEVDPFNINEAESIINWMQEHHPQMTIFFALGFYTGMRTGELLALKWSDIDFSKYTITVQRTITKNRIKESTKTEKSRTIDIIPALEAYLKNHKQYTFLKSDWVLTTLYNQPFMKTENINRLYFTPCLKALGFRYRTIYQMRHSFACMMIDAGENLNWIKSMLGHRTLSMIFKRYGNKINRQDGTRKGVIFSESVPKVCQIKNDRHN